jgi:hypothetical protein
MKIVDPKGCFSVAGIVFYGIATHGEAKQNERKKDPVFHGLGFWDVYLTPCTNVRSMVPGFIFFVLFLKKYHAKS